MEILSATYILFQTLNVIQIVHALFSYGHCFFTLNLFYLTCIRFFSKRFNYIARKLDGLKTSKQIDNRKLCRLIIEHNRVHHDLILINDFFKYQVGFNLVFFFAFGVTLMFVVLLDIDWRLVY